MSTPDLLVSGGSDRPPRLRARAALVVVAAAVAGVLALRGGGDGRPPAPAGVRDLLPRPSAAPAVAARLQVAFCDPSAVHRLQPDGALAAASEAGPPVRDCSDGLVLDGGGVRQVVGPDAARLRLVGSDGRLRDLAGVVVDPRPAPGLRALLRSPDAVGVGRDGTVFVGDPASPRVVRRGPDGRLRPLLPGGATPGADGAVTPVARPGAFAVGDDLVAYVADPSSSRVLRIDPSGAAVPVAGTGTAGSTGDGGPATSARLDGPRAVAMGSSGRLYVAEQGGRRVRAVDRDGTIRTFAGTGAEGTGGDGGLALGANFRAPADLAVDPSGNVYVVDAGAPTVRRVSPDGWIEALR